MVCQRRAGTAIGSWGSNKKALVSWGPSVPETNSLSPKCENGCTSNLKGSGEKEGRKACTSPGPRIRRV